MTGEQTTQLKVGGRVLRAGDTVKVKGLRGTWKIKHVTVWPDTPERPAEFTIFGGPRAQMRVVLADQIGTRKALAGKGK